MTVYYHWSEGVLCMAGVRYFEYSLREAQKKFRQSNNLRYKHIKFIEKYKPCWAY